MRSLFLDSNAHVPMNEAALKAYLEFNSTIAAHGHPSSPSFPGRAAAGAIEEARLNIAQLIGAEKPEQIIFTNSCTQACEWVGSMLRSAVISPIEHPAMEQAIRQKLDTDFHSVPTFKVTPDGVVEPGEERLDEVGVCIHMQNEIGTIQPISSLPVDIVVSDMSQSLGKMPVNVSELGVDIAVFGAHKFGGPSGVGFIYLKDSLYWQEFGSGSRYFMDIPGTPNVGGIVATAAALREAINTLDERDYSMGLFRSKLEPELKGLGFEVIGENVGRCKNTTFVKVPGKTNAGFILMQKLAKKGIHVGLGSACGSMYTGGSPLMQALGRPSDGQDYIRISQFGEYNNNHADILLKAING